MKVNVGDARPVLSNGWISMGKASRTKGQREKKPIIKCLHCGGRVEWPKEPRTPRARYLRAMWKGTSGNAVWCMACVSEAQKTAGTAECDEDNFYDEIIKDLEAYGD